MVVLSWRDRGSFLIDKIVYVLARLRFSQRDLGYLAKILDGWARLDEIVDISVRSRTSWQDLGCLGEIAVRLSLSRYEARNLAYIAEIAFVSARLPRSQQNFYKGHIQWSECRSNFTNCVNNY